MKTGIRVLIVALLVVFISYVLLEVCDTSSDNSIISRII